MSAHSSTRARRRSHLAPPPPQRPDPVRSEAEALRIFGLAASSPIEHETLAFFLDEQGVGGIITVIGGTSEPDALLEIVECLGRAAAQAPMPLALVIASMRPHDGVLDSDVQRWFAACDVAADHDIRLLDWFVIGPRGALSPRALCGEPDRWHLVTPERSAE